MSELDLSEKGRAADGSEIRSQRRLYMQLLVFTDCRDTRPLVEQVAAAGIDAVLYEEVNDPLGVGLLTMSENPEDFLGPVRQMLVREPFGELTPKPHLTMFGRTYAIGYESDLDEVLVNRPRHRALSGEWPWAVWYPLRRRGTFAQLPTEQQQKILVEHGRLGAQFGKADLAHDIRLACHGMDTNDNDFVVGLVGRELYPLSAVVQAMRDTVQTSLYLERLGPFFIGRACQR